MSKTVWLAALTLLCIGLAFPQDSGPRVEKQQPTTAPQEPGEGDIQLGRPVHAENPEVPKKFRGKFVGAVLGATLKTDGTFGDLRKLGGEDEFEDVALTTVGQWRYTPATLNGTPAETHVYVIFRSDNANMRTSVEADTPFSTKPRIPVPDQLASGELYRVGGKVKPPRAIYSPDPEFSEAARAAKYQGVLVLGVIIDHEGSVTDTWVARKLGLGLDQKALATVRQWKFVPATKDGQPVAVMVNVEVKFRLY